PPPRPPPRGPPPRRPRAAPPLRRRCGPRRVSRAAEVRFPAYTPEERLRLHALAEPLSARLGTPVRAETRDVTAVWFVRAV
ncbi:hypothetical protein ACFV3T_30680, partial [Streptomyces albidoflavus]